MSLPTRTIRSAGLALACLAAALLAGCGASQPTATVDRVERVGVSDDATTYHVHLTLDNPQDVALPLPLATYTLTVDGVRYRTDTVPNATLPKQRSLKITLPAVIENGDRDGEADFDVRGWITYHPPGQVRQFFYDLGWPRPSIMFFRQGETTPAAQ